MHTAGCLPSDGHGALPSERRDRNVVPGPGTDNSHLPEEADGVDDHGGLRRESIEHELGGGIAETGEAGQLGIDDEVHSTVADTAAAAGGDPHRQKMVPIMNQCEQPLACDDDKRDQKS